MPDFSEPTQPTITSEQQKHAATNLEQLEDSVGFLDPTSQAVFSMCRQSLRKVVQELGPLGELAIIAVSLEIAIDKPAVPVAPPATTKD